MIVVWSVLTKTKTKSWYRSEYTVNVKIIYYLFIINQQCM